MMRQWRRGGVGHHIAAVHKGALLFDKSILPLFCGNAVWDVENLLPLCEQCLFARKDLL